MKSRQNIFVTLLDLLNVKHTKSFSDQYFNEHPHKNNLYGLSKMLSDYGIHNAATRIEDKENDLLNIKCPFVAHSGGEFVVVEGLTPALSKGEGDSPPLGELVGASLEELEGVVYFLRNGKRIALSVSEFIKSWSGVILLAETSPDSGEPDYKVHRKKDLLTIAQQSILALAGVLILGFACINNNVYTDLGISLLFVTNLIGIYICYLLVLKQLRIHSRYADKICTLFSKSDCNNVLELDAAKLWGIFGWSEIGLGYFTANIIILLFLPHLITYLVIFNILALPFTVWSVWYQKMKAHQWCPLCLIVQVLLWAIFVVNLAFGYTNLIPLWRGQGEEVPILITQFIITGCIYTIPVFTLNLILPKLSKGSQVEQLRQEINSIKANEEVFKTLLVQQPLYEVSNSDSQILFGNPGALLRITILTNPFCNPCAKMHVRVDKLLKETKGDLCIQYIFSAFNESREYANRYFNAIYLEKGNVMAWQLLTDWFEQGKALQDAFFNDLQLDMSNPAIEVEFQKHESWKAKTQLRGTPTILVNGYKLPENYKIEDLRYFIEFNVDIK